MEKIHEIIILQHDLKWKKEDTVTVNNNTPK